MARFKPVKDADSGFFLWRCCLRRSGVSALMCGSGRLLPSNQCEKPSFRDTLAPGEIRADVLGGETAGARRLCSQCLSSSISILLCVVK